MIAGGIGITPFMAQMAQLEAMGGQFELHYSVRDRRPWAPMPTTCATTMATRVHVYHDDRGQAD